MKTIKKHIISYYTGEVIAEKIIFVDAMQEHLRCQYQRMQNHRDYEEFSPVYEREIECTDTDKRPL